MMLNNFTEQNLLSDERPNFNFSTFQNNNAC